MKLQIVMVMIVALAFSASAQKKKHPVLSQKEAEAVVLKSLPAAAIESAELEKEEGKQIWSFDVKIGGKVQEVWVDASTGVLLKTTEESAAKEADEQRNEKAERVALKKIPGEVLKTEMKEVKGKKIYSVEIKRKDGTVAEVDVDARTNKVLGVETEEPKQK